MIKLYPAGHTAALTYACRHLETLGYCLQACPTDETTHLLLPVPTFDADGQIKGGGDLSVLLGELPEHVKLIGGNLRNVSTDRMIDLLQDPEYIAKNADITAHCAVKVAMNHLDITLSDCPVLVIGWGRIGKCLATLLRGLGANVTVAARKETDRAMLSALHYNATDTDKIDTTAYRLIYNTAPSMILPNGAQNSLCIDLASKPGIGGNDVIWARGLPAKDAPESSGMLIAETVARILNKEDKS